MMNAKQITALAYAATAVVCAAAEKVREVRAETQHWFNDIPSDMRSPIVFKVGITPKAITIIPESYRDEETDPKQFAKLRTQRFYKFAPEAYGRCWKEIESSDMYQHDDCYARRIREVFNFALRKYEHYYGKILR